jgi:adenylate cyclase
MDEKPQSSVRPKQTNPNDSSVDDRTNVESVLKKLAPYLPVNAISGLENWRRVKKENVTVLSVDVRGFTSLAEAIDPEDCVNILNEYFHFAVELVLQFGGEVDNFQGDGFMAIFRDAHEGESHESRAVRCALRLREMAKNLNLPEIAGDRIPLGMGLNTGVAALARVGSRTRNDYTVIGDVVNVAQYLQRISGPDQIILSGNTRLRMGKDVQCTSLGYIRIKRRINRVEAFLIE